MVEINVIGDFNAALENKFKKDTAGLKAGDIALFNITSNGGEVEVLKRMAFVVYNLKQMGVKIATFVPEYANSAGFFFFLLGDYREISENASVHYHAPRIVLQEQHVFTKLGLSDMLSEITNYQDFTSAIFRESCDIKEDVFALIENAELPLNRENLKTLGIIN